MHIHMFEQAAYNWHKQQLCTQICCTYTASGARLSGCVKVWYERDGVCTIQQTVQEIQPERMLPHPGWGEHQTVPIWHWSQYWPLLPFSCSLHELLLASACPSPVTRRDLCMRHFWVQYFWVREGASGVEVYTCDAKLELTSRPAAFLSPSFQEAVLLKCIY